MKNKMNTLGQTARYKKYLNKKLLGRKIPLLNFKFKPSTVDKISLATNTAAYYGLAFGIQGYNDTWTAAVTQGVDINIARELAQQSAVMSTIWGAGTSIFVPSHQLYGAANSIFGRSFAQTF